MIVELLCTTIFFLQLCARLFLAPTVHQVVKDACFWYELVSVIPNVFMYILMEIQRREHVYYYSWLTAIAILRPLRIFRFARQITGLKVFLRALIHTMRDLLNLLIIFITMILFFGEVVFLIDSWALKSSIFTVIGIY